MTSELNVDQVTEIDPAKHRPKKLTLEKLTYVVQEIARAYHIKYLPDVQRVYIYRDGVYVNFSKDELGSMLQIRFNGQLNNKMVEEAFGILKRYSIHKINPVDLDPGLICVQNGILITDVGEIINHSPDWWFTNKLPVKYDPNADCPNIKKFFSEVLRPEDIPLIEEIFGWTLRRYEYFPHKAIMFFGAGRNGKSVMLRLIEALHGQDNVAHLSLDTLCGSRFAAVNLVDKMVNLFGDVHAKDLSDTAIFKCATGEDTFLVEEKFKQPFSYKNYAKMIFAANKLPKSPDDSDGFYSRWIIVEFPRQFTDSEQDQDLIKKLTTPEELSGLLNLAIRGLKRLRENGWTFSYNKSLNDVRKMYQRLSDPVYAFIEDCCEAASPDEYITKSEMYNGYKRYASERGFKVYTQKKFGQAIEDNTLVPVEEGKIHNGTVKVWRGIRWRRDARDASRPLFDENSLTGDQDERDRRDAFRAILPSQKNEEYNRDKRLGETCPFGPADTLQESERPHKSAFSMEITLEEDEPRPADSPEDSIVPERDLSEKNQYAAGISDNSSPLEFVKNNLSNEDTKPAALDSVSQRILGVLKDGRASALDIASKLGMIPGDVRRTLKALESAGYVVNLGPDRSKPFSGDQWALCVEGPEHGGECK